MNVEGGPPGTRVEPLRGQLKTGGCDLDENEAELVLKFSDRLGLLREEYSDCRHRKLLRHVIRIGEHGAVPVTTMIAIPWGFDSMPSVAGGGTTF